MSERLPHYIEILKDRREQIEQERLAKQLQVQELDKEIARIQAEDREYQIGPES